MKVFIKRIQDKANKGQDISAHEAKLLINELKAQESKIIQLNKKSKLHW